MGLYYRTMIKEIRAEFSASGETSVEAFLQKNEESLKKKWELGGLLFYLNILEVLREEKSESEYFKKKFQEESEEDEKFNTESFKKD